MSNDYKDIQIESTMPKPWEEEESFNDVLYDWMSKAPWLLISAALHFVFALIIANIPWNIFDPSEDQVVEASLENIPEPEIEEPEEEIEELEEETEEEPIIEDFEVSDHNETDTNEEFEQSESETNMNSDSPFDADQSNSLLGIGGGAGGKYGGRFGGKRNLRAGGGKGTEQAIKDGLEWLKNHQDQDGMWDNDEFMKHDPSNDKCDGAGDPIHDVGVTGLALLAFLGDGHTMTLGLYKDVVKRGIKWLMDEQDRETGLFGEELGHAFLYDHAIASLAFTETFYLDKAIILKSKAQKAMNYISRARNPYGVWRYEVPPDGENDTSVTGWMVFAMKSAEEGKLKIDREAYTAAIQWFDEMTDPATARVGYLEVGSPSSRVTGLNNQYPTDKGEALTAVALLCRFFLGQVPDEEPMMEKHAELLLKTLPKWEPEELGCDMYYWYYGTYAMYQMGGKYWKEWRKALEPAVLSSQRKDGSSKGSWDPVGPWGYSGGRVYSTATMVLCLEAYYRYARVLGGR
ncbi:MAG: prenyltransferase/squalene oxidase repeat-containing protein [Planctomycetota bacterium]